MKPLELQGKKFDKLLVLQEAGRDKFSRILWECQCDCGNETIVLSSRLLNGHTQSCGCLKRIITKAARLKISAAFRGSLHPNWQGGKTKEQVKIRNSMEYAEWRLSVFNRDGFKCLSCGQVGGILQAHHILSFSEYSKLRFDVDNGATLCRGCHKKLHAAQKSSMKKAR